MKTRKRKTPKKRKRKSSRYKTGVHPSQKCLNGPAEYRSGWEKEVLIYLDGAQNVENYLYEGVKIPYVSNIRTKKIRTYYPDFLIRYTTGEIVMVEVKRKDKLADPCVIKKKRAAEDWCQKEGIEYQIWTNDIIKTLKRINEGLT